MLIKVTMLYKVIAIIFINIAVISCTTTSPNLVVQKNVKATAPLNIMQPELNQEQVVKRGGVISHFETGFYLSTQIRKVELLDTTGPDEDNYPELKSGSITRLSKNIEGSLGACFTLQDGQFCLIDTDNNGYFERGFFNNNLIENLAVQYKVNIKNNKSNYSNQLRKQLVYRGITVDKIKFTYLEFKDDMIKPFIKRDFTISNHTGSHITLHYKGANFKIIKADNVNIVFESFSYLQ